MASLLPVNRQRIKKKKNSKTKEYQGEWKSTRPQKRKMKTVYRTRSEPISSSTLLATVRGNTLLSHTV